MKLNALRILVDEAYGSGAVNANTILMALFRNHETTLDSEHAWIEVPVVDIVADVEGGDLDLITGSADSGTGMTLSEVSFLLAELSHECGDAVVFVRGHATDGADPDADYVDAPVVASAINEEEQTMGVIVEFEGYDEQLG